MLTCIHRHLRRYLALPLLKHLLGVPITFSDLQFIDADVYRNLKWLKDATSVEELELDFRYASINDATLFGCCAIRIHSCMHIHSCMRIHELQHDGGTARWYQETNRAQTERQVSRGEIGSKCSGGEIGSKCSGGEIGSKCSGGEIGSKCSRGEIGSKCSGGEIGSKCSS
jgi:hypothetical protein